MSESPRILSLAKVGEGPNPVVLLHGFLGSGRNLSSLARRWAQRDPSLTLLLPDLTGHGVSPPLPEGADLSTMAEDLLATLQVEVGLRPVELVGHSLGGRVALAALSLHPERVRSVTLIDITPSPIGSEGDGTTLVLNRVTQAPTHPQSREATREFLVEGGISGPVADWILTNLVPTNGSYSWRIDRAALAKFRVPMSTADLWEVVERFPEKIRSIVGGDSEYVQPHCRQRLLSLGVPSEIVEGAGHFVHVDKPRELLELLIAQRGGS